MAKKTPFYIMRGRKYVGGKKVCPKCKEAKLTSAFTSNKRTWDKLSIHCTVCHNKLNRVYRLENPAKIREYRNRYKESSISRYYTIKRRAGQVGKSFEIEMQVFCDWYDNKPKLCYYCNTELLPNGLKPNSVTIDRKDNKIGYLLDNICLCCTQCNTIKGSWFTSDQMLQLAGYFRGGKDKSIVEIDPDAELPRNPYFDVH
ncbi:hypothetical protein LCGC14_2808480, partial [marine sediment metagenome]